MPGSVKSVGDLDSDSEGRRGDCFVKTQRASPFKCLCGEVRMSPLSAYGENHFT